MAPTNLIQRSFELAAERCEDITPFVYRRLFRQPPETEAMFRSEGSDLVKGSMLALAVDAMLDFAGDRGGHFRMIECEVASHDEEKGGLTCRLSQPIVPASIRRVDRRRCFQCPGSIDAPGKYHSRSRKFEPMSAFFLIGS